MNLHRMALSLVLLAMIPIGLFAQVSRDGVIVFKDGFHIKGRLVEKRDFIFDPASGQSIPIPDGKGFMFVDDQVRRTHFSPAQVQEVIPTKADAVKEQMVIKRPGSTRRGDMILPGWAIEEGTPWNDKWERTLKVKTQFGKFDMTQRLYLATPQFFHGLTVGYEWDFAYSPKEMGPELVRILLQQYFKGKKELKDHEKRRQLATFFQQVGWYDEAEKDLREMIADNPDQESAVKEQLEKLRQLRADVFVEETDRLFKTGRHQEAQRNLAVYAKQELAKLAESKNQLLAQDYKTRYEVLNTQRTQAKKYLADLVQHVKQADPWESASKIILDELNFDTVPRLETFLSFAGPHLRELEEKVKPAQPTEEILSLAVTGWLQGNGAAETDPKTALKLFRARQFVLDYLKAENSLTRNLTYVSFLKKHDLSIDSLVRLLRHVPPSHAYSEKLDTAPIKLNIEIADADNGTYHVQLPPEYHHHRSYPVLLALCTSREKPSEMMKRIAPYAAQHGYILVAPQWQQGTRSYGYTGEEQAIVLDTLRDLRRRFNVDSDRVFLFGWEDGASMAFDVGLSHPDQFAGVLPMNGTTRSFPQRCWSNAQYLPFYIVEGDRNGSHPAAVRGVFKDWIRGHYPSLYIEYKGRASEWYFGEVPEMFKWMEGKRRQHPVKEMGRYNTSGGAGEEFKTMRASDNRFYWLSTDEIHPRHINDYRNWVHRTLPATLQASISVGNESDLKKGARVWSQFNLRVQGLKQVTLWISPTMIDFTKPVVLRVNNQQVGGQRTVQPSMEVLLEELYTTGDRLRLFVAKIDVKL